MSTRLTPGTDTPWLRGLAVDEPAVPADLAMRAIARVSTAAVDRSPWSFVDDVLAMARRACLVGGTCAAGLALVTGVVHAADTDMLSPPVAVDSVDGVNGADVGNPLMSWWQGWDTAMTSTVDSTVTSLTGSP